MSACEALADRGLELVGPISHDEDPGRIEPEADERAREERAVGVTPVAAHELGARDDDDGARRVWPSSGAGDDASGRPA